MEKNIIALILIILGLIVLAIPILGVLPFSIITGLIILIFGLGLLFDGSMKIGENPGLGIMELILGIIALILGIEFIINPGLFSWVIGSLFWIAGLILIILGIFGIFTKTDQQISAGALITGIIYVIVGALISNPIILGILIGLSFLISGILLLLTD